MIRQNRLIIDLGAIRQNYRALADWLPAPTRVMAVVKANAYGHGLVPVARAVTREGAPMLAVAIPEEGVQLRQAGIQTPVLVLGAATKLSAQAALEYDLTQTVFDPDTLLFLENEAARLGRTAQIHIKLDTGMGRIGLRSEGEARALALALTQCPHVKATGIYTHFATADEPNADGTMNDYTRAQWETYRRLAAFFPSGLAAHVANSAAALLYPEMRLSMVREGIALYGYPPVPTPLPFRRAMRWETEVAHVKDVHAGDSIGYGCMFTADRPMRVATVSVGYGDGYHRAGSGKAQMLIGGQFAPVLGRICMDQTMVDVTEIPQVVPGAQAVLLGRQGENEIDADQLAGWAGTISYEVLLAVTDRVERTYVGE